MPTSARHFLPWRLARPLLLAVALAYPFLPDALAAPPAATAAVRHTEAEGITEYRLPNGLRILLAPDASQPMTTVNVTYLVGSRHENYGETGMAHLLEHLLFKGTPSLPGKTISTEFARRGMQSNGTTSQDRTNFFETFQASDDNLDWALRMEADRMVNSFVSRADLDSEMTVVRNEMELGENSPTRMLLQQMHAAAYRWHNYGKATIGARSDVERVSIERLQAFYRTYYQPDNAVLVVTGKFEPASTLARIERYFGAVPRPSRALPPEHTVEPPQEGAREITIVRPGDSKVVAVLYHVAPGAHPDSAALSLLASVLADTPGGRLYRSLVDTRKAAWQVAISQPLKDPGSLIFMAGTGKDRALEPLRAALIDELEGIAAQPVTQEELERARLRARNAYEQILNDPSAYGVALSEAIAKGDWRLFLIARDRVETATVEDLQRVAQQYLRPSNRTVGQFLPGDQPRHAMMPAAPDVAALVADYKGKPAAAAVETFDPAPASIEANTLRRTLPNGMAVALLPKPTRGGVVHGELVLRIGKASSLQGKTAIGTLTAGMLRRGAGGMDRQQIADRLEALKATVSISGNAESVSVQFRTHRAQLPELLALLRTLLREPTFPPAEFETLRASAVAGVESEQRAPEALAPNALGRHGNPYPVGDPRYTPTFAESIDALKAATADDVREFHARFYGADHAQLALVGDFDRDAALAQLGTLFGDWHANEPYARVDRPFVPIAPANFTLRTPGKANAVYQAAQPVDLLNDSPDFALLQIANRVFGGASLRSRLADRLRQHDGISYGAYSYLQVGALDRAGRFGLSAHYAPQNLSRLQAAVAEEFSRFVRDGITEAELAEATSGLLQQGALGRSRDGTLASVLVNQLYLGRSMAFTAEYESRLRAATRDAVNAAIRKYLNPAGLTQAYAGDFENVSSKQAATADAVATPATP